jgi:hypothetical protein
MININKYKKNGIYFEEYNYSQVPDQTAPTDVNINFVPGFSKTGMYNQLVLVSSQAQSEAIYGPLDRSLENKGSFFHRTINTLLNTSPVAALNLLKTNENDILEYRSVSLSPSFNNTGAKTAPYMNFFNKEGFWFRDRDALIDIANAGTGSENLLLHMTNMSNRKISVFMFKTSAREYNVTAEVWFGSRDDVPSYIRPTDLISDYMVRVVVLAGDWSDYKTLSKDLKWGAFFNGSGLRKEKVDALIADRNVKTLLNENCSLIPYFQKAGGGDMFIETVINQRTKYTGLFVSFDNYKFESDQPNHFVDLIGGSISNSSKSEISYMSYIDSIVEAETLTQKRIDRIGNVFGTGFLGHRDSNNAELSGSFNIAGVETTDKGNNTFEVKFNLFDPNKKPYVIIDGKKVEYTPENKIFTIPTGGDGTTTKAIRMDVAYVTADGQFHFESCAPEIGSVLNSPMMRAKYIPIDFNIPTNAVVIGVAASSSKGYSDNAGFTYVSGSIMFNYNDYMLSGPSNNDVTITFNETANPNKNLPFAWRRYQVFKSIANNIRLDQSVVLDADGKKVPLKNATVTIIEGNAAENRDCSITITADAQYNIRGAFENHNVLFFAKDDEFLHGTNGYKTNVNSYDLDNTNVYGIVGTSSELYNKFYNGTIQSGDHFLMKYGNFNALQFINDAGNDYIVFNNTELADAFVKGEFSPETGMKLEIKGHSINNGVFTIVEDMMAEFGTGTTAYRVAEHVTTTAASPASIYNASEPIFLQLYTTQGELNVNFFADKNFVNPAVFNSAVMTHNSQEILVISGESSFAQTLETQIPAGYTPSSNTVLIDGVRYAEVIVGNYLLAEINEEEIAEGAEPRRFVRITAKKPLYVNGERYVEITCDGAIQVNQVAAGVYQTTRFTSMEDYVDTYKALTFAPFIVRASSMPDGTEERQNEILNVIAKDTPMFEAITDFDTFAWRYLVDSFGKGLTAFSKQQFADICGARKNCIGFLNMPSVRDFKVSASPSFTDDFGAVNAEFIKTGGNIEKNPAFLYSFAEGEGKTSVGYFLPYVTVNEGSRPVSVPPAAFIANTYMRKNNVRRAGVYPWTIAAGTTDGRVLGIGGIEKNFSDSAVKELAQMGANVILYKLNKGYYIDSEYSAEAGEPIRSSLSYLHSREVLIELENAMRNLLDKYQHKFNTPAIRAEIKRAADDICKNLMSKDALYYFENIIDESNNTGEVIDNQMGIIDTKVEIVKGMGILLGRTYLYGTNQISKESTRFSGFGGGE